MGIEWLDIILEKNQQVFKAGDTVCGSLRIVCSKQTKVKTVYMQIKGFTNVHWTERRGTGPVATRDSHHIVNTSANANTIHFRAYEEYLNFNFIFLSEKSTDVYLEEGTSAYPFKVVLPEKLPTSFEQEHGRIRYVLHATVEIPWGFDKNLKKIITVISQVDLNSVPGVRDPMNVSEKRKLGCLCFESDPIYTTLSIKKTGFVPGEKILFNVMVSNQSRRTIGDVTVGLEQAITLKTPTRFQTITRDAGTQKFAKTIDEKTVSNWNGSLVVPAVSPSSLKTCRIIEIQYFLTLNLNPSGPSMDFKMNLPICIGTIPLTEKQMTDRNQQPFLYQPSLFRATPNPNTDEGDKEAYFDTEFAPHYPYYDDSDETPPYVE